MFCETVEKKRNGDVVRAGSGETAFGSAVCRNIWKIEGIQQIWNMYICKWGWPPPPGGGGSPNEII